MSHEESVGSGGVAGGSDGTGDDGAAGETSVTVGERRRASDDPAGHGPPVRRLDDWNGERLETLAAEYDTPLYVIDRERVRENLRRFRDAVESALPNPRVMYAAKANTGPAVLEAVLETGTGIECAARGELQRATAAGADPDTLRYTAVNPPAADLDYAVGLASDHPGLTVTAGARDTFDRLAERGYDGRVAIRVNPGIGTGHHEKVATGKDAKFGIPAEEVPAVAADLSGRFELVGLHAHVGSGVLHDDLDDHCRAIETVADLARETAAHLADTPGTGVDAPAAAFEFVDFGGGFGVPYRPDEEPLDLPVVAERVATAVGELPARVELEPGRYVVADAGTLLARVNTVKETPETTVVGVDASLATLVRPAMFDAYHAVRNVSGAGRETVSASVGGPCCTSADVFCTDRPLAAPERGDLVAVGNAGAYGYELASRFHSQPLPAEVAVDGDEARVRRERETMGDVTRLERD